MEPQEEQIEGRVIENVDLLQLSEVDKHTAEGKLSVEESRQIGKTVLIIEFCVQFFELPAPDLLASLNTANFHGEVPISPRSRYTDPERRLHFYWRPITLSNMDYKITP